MWTRSSYDRYESWDTTDLDFPDRNLLPEEDKLHSADRLVKSDPLEVNIEAEEASMTGLIDDIISTIVDNRRSKEEIRTFPKQKIKERKEEYSMWTRYSYGRYESWDTTDLDFPDRNLLPEEDKLHSADHLVKSDPLEVNIEAEEASMTGLIDDIISTIVDNKHCIRRVKSATCLVIQTLFWLLQTSEPLKRDNPLSLIKLARERKLAERKKI